MAVAYFMQHFPKNWLPLLNGGDLAVMFCFVFLYLWIAGPGPWSVDAQMRARRIARWSDPPFPAVCREWRALPTSVIHRARTALRAA